MDLGNIWVTKHEKIPLTTYLFERSLPWPCSFHLGTNKVATIGKKKIHIIVFHCTLTAIIALLPSGRFDE